MCTLFNLIALNDILQPKCKHKKIFIIILQLNYAVKFLFYQISLKFAPH